MKQKVLIVEDDPSFAEFLEVTVSAAGYETVTAHDGEKALRLFRSERPDLIFLDLLVPKRDGHSICAEIRSEESGKSVPIVVITGIYKKASYREAVRKEYDVTDYLHKPVRIIDLWDVLSKYLGDNTEPETETSLTDPMVTPAELFGGQSVQDRALAYILKELNGEKRTGLLFLKDSSNVIILYLEMGEVVFARSNDPSQRLGAVLEGKGVLSADDVQMAEAYMAKSGEGIRMGEVLVGMNLLTEGRLREVVQEHLEQLVMEAFRGDGWRAQFVDGDLPSEEEIRIPCSTHELILSGIREMGSLDRIRPHLPGPGCVLEAARDGRAISELLGLTPYEEKMLSLCDGTRTVRKILAIGSLAPVEIERLLFAFLSTGVVHVTGESEESAKRPGFPVPNTEGALDSGIAEGRIEGDLEETLLPDVVMRLYRGRRSGVLEVEGQGMEAWLYFDAGNLVFAGSNELKSRIGEILIESRLVTEEEVKRIADKGKDDGRNLRLGQRLVDEGLISLEELSWAITFQMQNRVLSLFACASGTWQFRPEPFPTDEPITLGFDTPDVVLEAIRRMDSHLLESRFPKGNLVLVPGNIEPVVQERLNLTTEERKTLGRIRRGDRIEDYLASAEFDEDMIRRALYTFLVLDLVNLEKEQSLEEAAENALDFLESGPPPPPRPRAPQPPPVASDLVPRVLLEQSHEKQEEMREQMYDIYSQFEILKQVVSSLRDEILTLKTSSLYDRMEPAMQDTVGSILDEYLARLEKSSSIENVSLLVN